LLPNASLGDSGGRIKSRRAASIDLRAPGAPIIRIKTLILESVYLRKDSKGVQQAIKVQMDKIENILGIRAPAEPPQP
jgi:hypothetical protein